MAKLDGEPEDQGNPLPWPHPSDDGAPDKAHLIHQDLADGGSAMARSVILQASAFDAFSDVRKIEVTGDQYRAVIVALDEIADTVITKLAALPVPDAYRDDDLAGKETLFLPYLAHAVFLLMGVYAGKMRPDDDHAKRYAWMQAFVRSWASYGVFQAATNAGVDLNRVKDLPAMLAITEPAPVSVLASLCVTRRGVLAEAVARGVDPREVVSEKMDALRRATRDDTVHGDPDDNGPDIAF